ncbi:MAG: clan AA aspartic protease [Planctomycetota bacterium]
MGLTYVTAEVRDVSGADPHYSNLFLVDTGANDCLADGDELRRINILPQGKRTYELADGSKTELEYGFARFSILGEETVAPIIFGPAGAEPILGVIVMESIGVVVDPRSNTLKRLDALPLKLFRS